MMHKLFRQTRHAEEVTARKIYQLQYCGIAMYITKLL